jgi:mono/diheme cytochrome c family protein
MAGGGIAMLRKLVVLALIAVVVGLGVFWVVTIPATVPASALPQRTPNLDNGKTMFFAGGCASCHASTGQDDKTKLGGGLGLKSPFGTFYVPNISPDRNDGIGQWTEAHFVTAMVKGTSPDGRHYFPAFPYTSYQRMKHEDLRDLFAYLKTLPAVQGRVRDHDVPFPFNVRRTLGGWKLLFLDGEPHKPDASKDAAWNRGAYLVSGPGHCAECHSPRNLLGGIKGGQRFAGGPSPEGGDGWVPNITQHGLSAWTRDDIVKLLATGENRDADTVGGEMGKVVSNLKQLGEKDIAAMAAYIKSLPAVEGPRQPQK